MKLLAGTCVTAFFALLSACSFGGVPDDQIYTLYRNSVLDPSVRAHVATFDSSDGETYNLENCQQTQALIMAQKGEPKKFWCEKGRFKK